MMVTPRTKQLLLIALFLASAIGIAAALYFTFFSPAASPITPQDAPGIEQGGTLPTAGPGAPAPTTTPGAGALPQADEVARGGLTKTTELTTAAVGATTLAGDGDRLQYYDPNDGRFYRIDEDGAVQKISDTKFPAAESIAWDAKGEKAVLEFPDGSNIIYDVTRGTQVTLPAHWEDLTFTPSSGQVVGKSIGTDPRNRSLVVSNADGSQVKAVQDLGNNADKVRVAPAPHEQIVAFSDTGPSQSGLGRRLWIPIGQNKENFKGLIVEGLGFEPKWSPRGDTLLYSATNLSGDGKPQLWLVDGGTNTLGDNRRRVSLNTWADKCSFTDESVVYCAVPRDLPANAGLQRELAQGLADDVYRVDLTSGRTRFVGTADSRASMQNLRVSSDERLLYFQNARTRRLELMRLK